MMASHDFDPGDLDIAWCPGCGNYQILKVIKETLTEMELDPVDTVLVSGIGQAAKAPQYIKANFFNGLHGRALPAATAIKAANPSLTVIAESGDGDMYGEGGNHFIHAIRRNPDIVNIVHNNMIYGLTKGQASPTTPRGLHTTLQFEGVMNEPFNPMAVAISLKASFVARAFCADQEQFKDILKKAIEHKGYALVDVLQPCVSYNDLNTYAWFKEHTYYLPQEHDPTDRVKAFTRSIEEDPLPLGIFYEEKDRPTFTDNIIAYSDDRTPIIHRKVDIPSRIEEILQTYR
jgi:2-oxoglutarate/2-oxoacid ferredoxin oxidoreductase subunit beta